MNFFNYIVIAHGALGWWDDLIFLGIITIFVGFMVFSWFRSRGDDFESVDLMPTPKKSPDDAEDSSERFELE